MDNGRDDMANYAITVLKTNWDGSETPAGEKTAQAQPLREIKRGGAAGFVSAHKGGLAAAVIFGAAVAVAATQQQMDSEIMGYASLAYGYVAPVASSAVPTVTNAVNYAWVAATQKGVESAFYDACAMIVAGCGAVVLYAVRRK